MSGLPGREFSARSVLHRRRRTVHDGLMKMLRALLPLALALVFGCCFSGCTTVIEKGGIVVSVEKIVADDAAASAGRFVLQLRLRNETLLPIAISSSEIKVRVNDVAYGKAVGEKPVALRDGGAAPHEALLVVADAGAASRLRAALAAGTVEYALDCRLLCDAGDEDLVLLAKASGRTDSR